MILYEFALDPAVLSTWKDFRYFYDRFGIWQGRVISRFPSRWKKLVIEAVADSPVNRKRIVEKLNNLDGRLFKFGRDFDPGSNWLDNAIREHGIRPFRAIISSSGLAANDYVLGADDIDDETTLWAVKTQDIVEREANVLADWLAPLVEISSDLIIIDQHLEPTDGKFQNFLGALLNRAILGTTLRRLEIHGVTALPAKTNWTHHCKTCLAPLIPGGLRADIFRWEKAVVGKRHHARYVMTELGGAWIDSGTDEQPDDDTNIANCDRDVYRTRLAEYTQGTSPFNFVDKISVVGTKT